MIPLTRKSTSTVSKRKAEEVAEKNVEGGSSLSKEAVTAILEGKLWLSALFCSRAFASVDVAVHLLLPCKNGRSKSKLFPWFSSLAGICTCIVAN